MWVHYFQHFKQRLDAGDSAPKKVKTITSTGKVMFLFYYKGSLAIEYLTNCQTINGNTAHIFQTSYMKILGRQDLVCKRENTFLP